MRIQCDLVLKHVAHNFHRAMADLIQLTDQNFEQLQKYFDMDGIKKLATLFHEISEGPYKDTKDYGFVDSLPIDNKDDRKTAHQVIRAIFLERILSNHQEGNIVRCTPAANAISRKGKSKYKHKKTAAQRPLGWNQLGGDYMHFTLYKENRDSGDILGFISSKLNMKGQKAFDVAGNKDRRAVTVQRVSAYRVKADRFMHLNDVIKQAHIGDCCYSQNKLQLGDLAGNEFLITLRDCTVREPDSNSTSRDPEYIKRYINQAMQNLRDKGFINYYGLQRFGTFAARTDLVGQYMLKEDYKAAVDTILDYSPAALQAAQDDNDNSTIASDDQKRAQAIHWFLTKSAPPHQILETLPRRFTAEYAIVSFLLKTKDQSTPYYRGALECIPRNLRSFYPHAYQSLIWNLAATHRWNLSPGKLLPGDLILTNQPTNSGDPYSTDPDPIYAPSPTTTEHVYALTQQDIVSNTYSIFDIVLPLPGHNVIYPTFMLPLYRTTMQTHGNLDPEKMQRNWRETSLPGSYRKLLGRPGQGWACKQIWYHEPDAKIALTDWERLETRRQEVEKQQQETAASVAKAGEEDTTKETQSAKEEEGITKQTQPGKEEAVEDESLSTARKEEEEQTTNTTKESQSTITLAENIPSGDRLGIILKFQLQSSTYATMALRELMKTGPVEYKPEFSGGRGL